MGASARRAKAWVIRLISSRLRKPLRNLCESTRASAQRKRKSRASRAISRLKTAAGLPCSAATYWAMFRARAVFPMAGGGGGGGRAGGGGGGGGGGVEGG